MAIEQQEEKEEQRQLLLHTLNRLWSHYLQAPDSETDDNQAASVKVCIPLGYLSKSLTAHLSLSLAGTLALVTALQLSVLG